MITLVAFEVFSLVILGAGHDFGLERNLSTRGALSQAHIWHSDRSAAADTRGSDIASRIGPHTYEIVGGMLPGHQPDGNTYILESPTGLTVIDTGRHPDHLLKIESFATAKHASIVAIINTHWHLDHVSGNIGLRKAYPGVKVYASGAINDALTGFLAESADSAQKMLAAGNLTPLQRAEIEGDLATINDGDALRPDVVLTKDELLNIGGRTLRVYVAHDAATAGDVWLLDPRSRIAFVGDLVTFPAAFLDTACGDGWTKALENIARIPFRAVAPGHGPLLSREQFYVYIDAFRSLLSCSASSDTATSCAEKWIDRVAVIGRMTDQEKESGLQMTSYYVTDVLRKHGGNSGYCSLSRSPRSRH